MNAPQGAQAPTFARLYQSATGHLPPAHQARAAATGLPAADQVPAGDSKTGLVLAWLWRRLHGPAAVRAGTARRLVWALPQGRWSSRAGRRDPPLARPPRTRRRGRAARGGGRAGARARGTGGRTCTGPRSWWARPTCCSARRSTGGTGCSRAMCPIDFALTVNGAHWVIDEARLCPQATTTLRQLAGFAGKTGTAEPLGLTVLSAAPQPAATFRRLAAEPGDYRAIAASALDRHAPGHADPRGAQHGAGRPAGLPAACADVRADVTLLHARFRGIERAAGSRSSPARRDQGRDRRRDAGGGGGRRRPRRRAAHHGGGAVGVARPAGPARRPHPGAS